MQEENHIFQGLKRDNHEIRQEGQYLWNAHNIRLTNREDSTLLSITNEKGTSPELITFPEGRYVGHCVLGKYLVVFTHDRSTVGDKVMDNCCIYRVEKTGSTYDTKILFRNEDTKKGWNVEHPIETIGVYENDLVQKVYWIDGINQPRVINIIDDNQKNDIEDFNFIPSLKLKEHVKIEKNYGEGMFAPGVIQYAFTYYNKYGQESNIFYTTPLNYITPSGRGGNPEERVSNSFRITLENVDIRFDYLRIYSIHRTSIDAVPTVKRVTDIPVSSNISYTDTGTTGDTVDPTLLLYIGGRDIVPQTMCAKDGTLFFGNIEIVEGKEWLALKEKLTEAKIPEDVLDEWVETDEDDKSLVWRSTSTGESIPVNDITGSYYSYEIHPEIKGFKSNEKYRCGIQFQYKTGAWSEPVFIEDRVLNSEFPGTSTSWKSLNLALGQDISKEFIDSGYINARACVVFPTMIDRDIICQGVLCPTVFSVNGRNHGSPYAMSSWFFRPSIKESKLEDNNKSDNVKYGANIQFRHNKSLLSENNRGAEIQGTKGNNVDISTVNSDSNLFFVDSNIVTFHSPDVEFDTSLQNLVFNDDLQLRIVGKVLLEATIGDIDIQTSSPMKSTVARGFVRRTIGYQGGADYIASGGLVSGLFYQDGEVTAKNTLMTEDDEDILKYYMIYPWNRSGSLNNSPAINAEDGVRSAVLSKKKISNLKFFNTKSINGLANINIDKPVLFNSNEVSLSKIHVDYLDTDINYYGNVDTLVTSNDEYNIYVGGEFTGSIGNIPYVKGKAVDKTKDPVRMKYKSTPHLVFSLKGKDRNTIQLLPVVSDSLNGQTYNIPAWDINKVLATRAEDLNREFTYNQTSLGEPLSKPCLFLAELVRKSVSNKFGGNSDEAKRNNLWFPAGPPVALRSNYNVRIPFSEGDTWYSRYDCLKTYPFTQEDENQIVEIGSFMCETRVNIDGRYDKNRGQLSNLNMSPVNFNLLNEVYSQKNNFFNYRIYEEDFYKNSKFANQITWSLEKTAGSDTDAWTNITLANTLDMDGTKGDITAIRSWNENLLCFQEKALSMVMFNSRVQIPTTDGVPIEISNGYKVDGSRLISSNIGCQNKWSIIDTSNGLYFLDSDSDNFYIYNGQLANLSEAKGMTWWSRENHAENIWSPVTYEPGMLNGIRTFYDKKFGDVYFTPGIITASESLSQPDALCYSEKLGQFTSLMSYGGVQAMFNFADGFYTLKNEMSRLKLYQNNVGEYNNFFGYFKPWSFSFISNQNPAYTKIFDTVETRADYYFKNNSVTALSANCPFNIIQASNEYQDTGKVTSINMRKKFRVWRGLIPRNKGTRERIRNPWSMITLGWEPDDNNTMPGANTGKAIVHDVTVKYTM